MDNRPVNSLAQEIEENARKVFSLPSEDNGTNRPLGSSCTAVKIKEEINDEIQEYAATTMSELLGWYGYDKVDNGCTRSLNLDHFTSTPTIENSQTLEMDKNIASWKLTSSSPTSVNTSNSFFEVSRIPLSYSTNNLISMNRQLVLPTLPLKKVSINATSKYQYESYQNSICSDKMSCSWCGKIIEVCESERPSSPSYNMINTLGHFCSETCFTAGKRAIFKRAKTCDWCRHIQNPMNCIDFQDDESQLQFCSERCLNQYKINIFCHETQTHLMLQGLNNVSFHDTEEGGLITPEMWFRGCQSPLNCPTKSSCLAEEHLTTNLSVSLHNTQMAEKDKKEKSIVSNKKVSRKKDSICANMCAKRITCSERRKSLYTESNGNNINAPLKEQAVINEDSKFCYFMNRQTQCRVDCKEESDWNYQNLKRGCTTMSNVCYNSNNNKKNEKSFERNIHVKNIKNLQEKRHNSFEDMLHLSSGITNSTASIVQRKISFLPKSCTNKSHQTKYEYQTKICSRTSSSKDINHTESFNTLSTAILPPVTVLVPYPVPLPIPIPILIPVPIPTVMLNKLMNDKHIPINNKELSCKNMECKDPMENTGYVPGRTQINISSALKTEKLQHLTSDKFCVSSSILNTLKKHNDKLHPLKQNVKPLRKRKRSNEIINYRPEEIHLKKRNKCIAT